VRYISERQLDQLATRADLDRLRHELVEIKAGMAHLATKTELVETREALRGEIAEVRESLRGEIAEVRESLRGEIAEVRVELIEKMSDVQTKLIIWLVGTAIASVSLMAAIGQLLK